MPRPATLADRVVTLVPKSSVETFYLNVEKPQFKELAPCARRSMLAIDKSGDHRRAQLRRAHRRPRPSCRKQSFYYNPDLPKQEFNLEACRPDPGRRRLAAGRDGIRAKDGVRLSFANSTTAGPSARTGAAVHPADLRRDRRRDDHLEPAVRGDVGRVLGAVAVRFGHRRASTT
jgi:peptide/nickel transport system substrate-binding protein